MKKDNIEFVPIPMDRETRERLVALAELVGDHPVRCAATLLSDLMRDDELFNTAARGRLNS